jgi:hypothetical protein
VTIDLNGFDDDRPDHERAENAALGVAVAHAAQELLAEGEDPRAIATAFLSTSLAISLSFFGKDATVALLADTADDVASLRMGGCAGSA